MTTDRTKLVEATDQHAALEAVIGARRDQRRRRLTMGLVVWDALVPVALLSLVAQFSGAFGVQMNGGPAHSTDSLALLLAVTAPIGLGVAGGYDHRRRRGTSRLAFAMRLLLVGVSLSWLAIIASAAADWPFDFSQMLAIAVLMPAGWLVGRAACDRHPAIPPDRVLLVGSGFVADRVVRLTSRHPERRMAIVGAVAEPDAPATGDGIPRLGSLEDLPEVLKRHDIDRVVVGFTREPDTVMLERLRECVAKGLEVDIVPRFFNLVGPSPRATSLGSLALVEVPGVGLTTAQRAAKRAFDLVGASVLLIVSSPVFLAASIAIVIADGRPVFFRQLRQGRQGRSFMMVKFRSMRSGGPVTLEGRAGETTAQLIDGHKLRAATATTTVGKLLRKTSIDELPQVWNVLRGDMSLVGPRPLPLYEAEHLTGWHTARQDLKPGLTGLWQVSGRSSIDWDERMELDYTYVSHWSLVYDVQILLRTLPAVLRKDGAV